MESRPHYKKRLTYMNQNEIELLSKKQVAKILNVTSKSIDNYSKENLFPSYKIGGAVRFKKSEVLQFIEGTKQTA